jgi:hypothetical protein
MKKVDNQEKLKRIRGLVAKYRTKNTESIPGTQGNQSIQTSKNDFYIEYLHLTPAHSRNEYNQLVTTLKIHLRIYF